MQHATLYKRTKTGAIQQWTIEVESNGSYPVIVKRAGQLGGKITQHREVVAKGKNLGKANETSPLEQAESQALSDWTKKHQEGYKTLVDIGIVTPGQDHVYEFEGTGYGTLEAVLNNVMPKFNTTGDGAVLPMLAKPVNWDKVTYPCLVQPKLDGVRCLMVINLLDEPTSAPLVQFLSRNGKEYTTLDHITLDVLDYIGTLANDEGQIESQLIILDGEIYSHELTFQEIVAAVKKQRPDSLKLKFRAYDIVNSAPQHDRIYSTEELVNNINSPYVTMVGTEAVQSKERIMELYKAWFAQGYEGAMIRLMDGTYDQGQRSSSLLKVKEFLDGEFAFKNFEFGQRGVEDLIAVCWDHTGTKEFRAKMQGSKADKEKLYALNDLEGKSITIRYFELTDDGLPRFPIGVGFRDYE